MRRTDNTFAMNTGANGGDWRAEQIVCLLRDMAERLVKGNGVDSMTPAASCVRSIMPRVSSRSAERCGGMIGWQSAQGPELVWPAYIQRLDASVPAA
jgi:hypothetical protein